MDYQILHGSCASVLPSLPSNSIHCCITSPPYWGLRDYGVDGQLGQESTPEEFVKNLVSIFREVWRVLRDDGTLWLNLGDSYSTKQYGKLRAEDPLSKGRVREPGRLNRNPSLGLKPKELVGIPWKVAFALQTDGWYLRQDIIWNKTNPMPESVTDRCTKSHEYLFLLTKKPSYFFNTHAIKEPAVYGAKGSEFHTGKTATHQLGRASKKRGEFSGKNADHKGREGFRAIVETRTKRDVWTISSSPYKGAHFATFPPKLIEPCVLAGTSAHGCCSDCGAPWKPVHSKSRIATRPGTDTKATGNSSVEGNRDPQRHVTSYELQGWEPTCKCVSPSGLSPATVLDPFSGSGTTGTVAIKHGRKYIGIELNQDYIELSHKRLRSSMPAASLLF